MERDKEQLRLEQILAKAQRYIVKSNKTKRDLDAINGSLEDLQAFIATLVNDFKKQGIIK